MRLDAPTFARAWLAVAQASATRDDLAAFSRTMALEEYPQGIRLVATDRYTLLTAWVPCLDVRHPRQPALYELPDRVVVASDADGRGKGLLGYVLKITRRDELDKREPGALEVRVDFDVRIPAGQDADQPLEGLEPTYVLLTVPDVERVYLNVVEAAYPDWRPLLLDHHPEDTKAISFATDRLARIAGVSRYAEGPLVWEFGGDQRVARVHFPEADPLVEGLVMPSRWVLDGEQPTDAEVEDTPAEAEVPLVEPLLADAATAVVESQLGSARHIARRLNIGQDRARDLLDQLEANGIVGPTVYGRSRDVLATPDQLTEVLRGLGVPTDV